jgi:hypothetical protein
MIRDTYQVFHSFMHLIAQRDLPAGLLGGVKGFHTQRLETAKGLPSQLPLIPLPQERGLQWRLKAALARRISTEPTEAEAIA